MKKTIIWMLIVCLCVFSFAGCSKPEAAPEEAEEQPQSAGGWAINTDPVTPDIPEEAKEALDAAVADLTGAKYELIAYLGSQVVAGANYGFLCRVVAVSPQSEAKLCIVKVYRDLDGNASILDTKDVSIADCVADGDPSYKPENLAGGWTLDSELSAELPEAVQTAFDKATEGLMGVKYQPLACLGSQVVAGCNYAVLCNAVSVTAEPQSALAVLTIYADLEGGAKIMSVSGFDFP